MIDFLIFLLKKIGKALLIQYIEGSHSNKINLLIQFPPNDNQFTIGSKIENKLFIYFIK